MDAGADELQAVQPRAGTDFQDAVPAFSLQQGDEPFALRLALRRQRLFGAGCRAAVVELGEALLAARVLQFRFRIHGA
jgi:hypothetical protein